MGILPFLFSFFWLIFQIRIRKFSSLRFHSFVRKRLLPDFFYFFSRKASYTYLCVYMCSSFFDPCQRKNIHPREGKNKQSLIPKPFAFDILVWFLALKKHKTIHHFSKTVPVLLSNLLEHLYITFPIIEVFS